MIAELVELLIQGATMEAFHRMKLGGRMIHLIVLPEEKSVVRAAMHIGVARRRSAYGW
jgi:hypothetical protein